MNVAEGQPPRLLVTGASGHLGAYLLRELARQGRPAAAWSGRRTGRLFACSLRPVDLADAQTAAAALEETRPDVIVHAAAVARVDACRANPERARAVNTRGTELLAQWAEAYQARMVLVSTDLVFDGRRGWYREGDPPRPLSVYGRTKAEAERAVLGRPRAAVARVSLMFGPSLAGEPSFFDRQVAALRAGRPVRLFDDEWRTPLAYAAAAQALLALADSDFSGVVHVAGPERLSRWAMGRELAARLGAAPELCRRASREQIRSPEPRPADVSLDTSRWRRLFPEHPIAPYREALARQLEDLSA